MPNGSIAIIIILTSLTWRPCFAEPAFTIPTCNVDPVELPALDFGSAATIMSSGLHCTSDNLLAEATFRPHLLTELLSAAPQDSTLREVTISSYLFDGPFLSSAICKIPGIASSTVRIIAQADPRETNYGISDIAEQLSECAAAVRVYLVGCNIFRAETGSASPVNVVSTCSSSVFQSYFPVTAYHAKFISLRFEENNGEMPTTVVAIGSGNMTGNSLYVNIEDWYLTRLTDPATQASWDCAQSYFIDLATYPLAEADSRLAGCRAAMQSMLKLEGQPDFMVLPADASRIRGLIAIDLASSSRVRMVAQFFEWKWFMRHLATIPDTPKQILVDASYVVSSRTGQERNFISPRKAKLFLDWAESIENLDIRFLQTNHFFCESGFSNSVHARSLDIEMEDGSRHYYLLSAHFRDASFERNAELGVMLSGVDAVDQSDFFYQLGNRAIMESDVAGRIYQSEECTNG